MRVGLIAAACALALLVATRFFDAPNQTPHWTPAEIESHFHQTARGMGVDASKMRPDSAVENGRLVVLASRNGAAVRIEYSPGGRVTRWDCTRCPGLQDQPASDQTARLQMDDPAKAQITIRDGKVTKASAKSSSSRAGNPPGRTLARVVRGVGIALFWTFLSFTFFSAWRIAVRPNARRVAIAVTAFWWLAFLISRALQWTSSGPEHAAYHLMAQPVLWLLPCAAGLLKIRAEPIGKWLGFLHAAERWRPARRTGIELWNGLLLGWPLALAARLAGPRANAEPRNTFAEYAVLYFAFMAPLLGASRWVQDPKWRQGYLLGSGLLLFGGVHQVSSAYPLLDLLSGLLMFGIAVWSYTVFGLLGVLSAAVASGVTGMPVAAGIGVYGSALAVAAWLRKQGFAGQDEDLAAEVIRLNTPQHERAVGSERQFLLTEFAEAREAQMGMLPAYAPAIPGYSLAAVCIPAREVGGDLYDIIGFRDGKWGFCVADVSGKGVPAALYMTMTKGVLASEQRITSDLKTLTLALNERLHQAAQKKIFVTMAFASLDPVTRGVQLIRAGHNPVLWRRAGRHETVWLKPGGLGLGLVPNRSFQKSLAMQAIELEAGDTLILYSDGLTEAENMRVELYGEERLESIVERSDAGTADALIREILADVERFKEGADPHDDLTLLVLKVTGE